MIKVNGKLQQPNPGGTTNGPDPSGMKVRVIPPGKESRPAEVLAEDKGNTRRIVEKGSNNTSCDHMPSYRHESYNCLSISFLYCYEYVYIHIFGKRLCFFPLLFTDNIRCI